MPFGVSHCLCSADNHHFDGMLNNAAKSRLEQLAPGDPRIDDLQLHMGHRAAAQPYHAVEASQSPILGP